MIPVLPFQKHLRHFHGLVESLLCTGLGKTFPPSLFSLLFCRERSSFYQGDLSFHSLSVLNCCRVTSDWFHAIKVSRVNWLWNFANYIADYNAALFHVVCRVMVMIFCSRCDGSLDHWPFAHLHLKVFCNLCRVMSYNNRERENKNIDRKSVV